MSLRYRTALATVISVMLIMGVLLAGYRFVIGDAYRTLERERGEEEMQQTLSVLRAEERALDVLLTDWTAWDDMYDFVESRSAAFVTSNLPPEIMAQLNLNALVIRSQSGAIVIGRGRSGTNAATTVPGLTDAIPDQSPLLRFNAEGRMLGVTSTPLGPMIFASRPILRSDGSGAPRGAVVMARLIDETFTERLSEMLMMEIHALPLDSSDVPAAIRAGLEHGAEGTILTEPRPDNRLITYAHVRDVSGRPTLILCLTTERTVEAQSGRTLRTVLLIVGGTGVGLVALLMAAMQVTVVGRLRHLLHEMDDITGRGSSEGLRTHVTGRDEIGDVAAGINAMLDRLEAAAIERARLEQAVSDQQRLAEEAFHEVGEGLLVVDRQDRCTACNPAALRMLGCVEEREVIGRPLGSVLPVLRPTDDAMRSAGDKFFELNNRVIAVSRSGGETPGHFVVVVMRDVTDVRAVERLKSDLVATVSHELRTPLTAIQATVSMLNEGDGGALTAVQERLVSLLDRNTQRLRMLVDDLLEMGALEGGRVTLYRTPADLAEICHAVIDDVADRASLSQITLQTDLHEATAWVDTPRIRQVIDNLVQNAVKFTPAGGSVFVSAGRTDGHAVVVVRDTGIGIAPEDIDHVFDKFYRSVEATRFAPGTGLGLSIARSIVTLHGGRLIAESDGRTGTTMTLELPTDPPPPDDPTA